MMSFISQKRKYMDTQKNKNRMDSKVSKTRLDELIEGKSPLSKEQFYCRYGSEFYINEDDNENDNDYDDGSWN